MLSTPPLSLYVHLPWCERKCPYCDFNSHAPAGTPPFARYVQRLLDDLTLELPWIGAREIVSVFIGGGTPSLFPAECIEELLRGIRARATLAADAEITLEANPGSAEISKFRAFCDAGINRLSIGVQSFDDKALRALGRVHDAAQARRAPAFARESGFAEINIDLMHGLPGQGVAEAVSDLEIALSLAPTHLSWYQLTIEPNTQFHAKPPLLPEEPLLAEIQERGERMLAAAGFGQYEVSAYARAGHVCRHNLNYWQFGDYLGIGAGAHGKLSDARQARVVRTRRTRVPRDYLDSPLHALRVAETVPAEELPLEFLMNALRLREGATVAQFEARTGWAFAHIAAPVARLRERGLLEADPSWLRATPLGYRFLDSVLGAFG